MSRRSDPAPSSSGAYNSHRAVPPPRTSRPVTSQSSSHHPPSSTPSLRVPLPSVTATSIRNPEREPYVIAIVVHVDNATEPAISDEQAATYRTVILDILHRSRKVELPNRPYNISPGQAVAFALRKRLKCLDVTAIHNTLALTDFLMRNFPYFFRYLANDKFFRRLWRFVDPDYKDYKSKISMFPLLPKSKTPSSAHHQDPDISRRVLIFIRAWAEELSVMFNGRVDPDAHFFVERYRNKRSRIRFPELPESDSPWVCPVSYPGSHRPPSIRAGATASSSSSPNLNEDMSLDEVENTVNLFASVVDNATSIDDLREDLCTHLARRCETISASITQLSDAVTGDEQLSRIISSSELLQRTLRRYRRSLQRGQLESMTERIPNTVGLDSGDEDGDENYDESYDHSCDGSIKKVTLRSEETGKSYSSALPRGAGSSRSELRETRASVDSGDRRGEERRKIDRGRGRERESERESEHSWQRDGTAVHDRTGTRSRDRGGPDGWERESPKRAVSWGHTSVDRKHEKSVEERTFSDSDDDSTTIQRSNGKAPKGMVIDKRTRKSKQDASGRKERIDGSLQRGSTKAKKKAVPARKDNLIDVREEEEIEHSEEDDDDDESDDKGNEESFQLLAERYASSIPESTRSGRKQFGGKPSSSRGDSSGRRGMGTGGQSTGAAGVSGVGGPGLAPGAGAAGLYQTTVPTIGVNPMMMMGNPYGMYATVNPLGMGDPMGLFNAYATVNPTLYLQSVNAGMAGGMVPPTTSAKTPMGGVAGGNVDGKESAGNGGADKAPIGKGSGSAGAAGSSGGGNSEGGGLILHTGQEVGQGQQMFSAPAAAASLGTASTATVPGAVVGTAQNHADVKGSVVSTPSMGVGLPIGPGGMGMVGVGGMGMPMGMSMGMGLGGVGHAGAPLSPPPTPMSPQSPLSVTGQAGLGGQVPLPGQGPMAPLTVAQQAGNQAAMYQSAMQQAATTYHLAATAYKTMQGQAAIAQAQVSAMQLAGDSTGTDGVAGPSSTQHTKDRGQ